MPLGNGGHRNRVSKLKTAGFALPIYSASAITPRPESAARIRAVRTGRPAGRAQSRGMEHMSMLNANPRNFLLSTLPEVLHHADGCIRHVYFPTDAIVSMMHVSEARSSTAAATSVSSIDPCSNKRPASAINEPARPGRLRGSGCHRNPARLQQRSRSCRRSVPSPTDTRVARGRLPSSPVPAGVPSGEGRFSFSFSMRQR